MSKIANHRRGFLKTIVSASSTAALLKESQSPALLSTVNISEVRSHNNPARESENSYSSLAKLKSADPHLLSYNLVSGTSIDGTFIYETANAPYIADDINVIKLDRVDLSAGAAIRQSVNSIATSFGQNAQSVFDRIIKFENVSDMLADHSSVFVDGLIVNAGGHRYKVASLDASDYHLTTKGGAKLYILPTGGSIPLEALNIDIAGVADATAKLKMAGQAARFNRCGISCGRGIIKFAGNSAIDWQGIEYIDSAAEFLRAKDSKAYFVVGGNQHATAHSRITISAYDISDQFAIDRKKPELLRLQGIKHFDLQGRISKVVCFSDGNEVGAESGGYGKINAEIYTLEIISKNGGWFNHVHVHSQRLVKFLSYRSDGSYKINGWTVEGLFELANAEIDLEHIADVKIRGRFETAPAGFIKLRQNSANILIINTNSNGRIQPWYQNWRTNWIGQDEGLNNRAIHEAHIGLDHRLMARFDANSVVSDGTGQSCAGKGWLGAAMNFTGDGVTFSDANAYVLATPWIKAKKGDIFSSNADADGPWCRPCLELMKVDDGSIPTADPDVVQHAFNKFPRTSNVWAYSGDAKAGTAPGSYYLTKAQKGFDAFMYTGVSGEYYVRMVLRVFAANSATVRSAALWWTGRDAGAREADLITVTDNPSLLSAAPKSPAPIGTLAHDGDNMRVSIKFEETAVKKAMAASSIAITFARHCPTASDGDLIMIAMENGERHLTTLAVGNTAGGKIADPLPSNAARGGRIWIGKWV